MKINQNKKSIPNGWKLYQLRQLGEFKNGVNKSKKDFGHGSPFVNLMDIFGHFSIKSKRFGLVNVSSTEIENYSLKRGDILFVRSSVKPEGVGLATLVEEDLKNTVYSGFIIRFRSNNPIILHGFKKYSFQNSFFRNKLIATSSVSANTNINQEALNKLPILLPPLPEQNRIVAVLETWDKAIEKLAEKIELKKNIKKGLMQRLLTGKVRLPGFSETWQVIKLGEVGEVITGNTPPMKELENYNGPYCWATAEDFNSKYIFNTAVKLTEQGKLKSRFLPAGSILVTCIASIGKNALAGVPLATNQQINAVIVNDKNNNEFIYYLIENSKKLLINSAGAGAMPILNKSEFLKLKMRIPKTKKEQTAIANILIAADKEIEIFEQKLKQLKDQKKYLLNNLITGAIRTPETIV